jgi:hypothetical protein
MRPYRCIASGMSAWSFRRRPNVSGSTLEPSTEPPLYLIISSAQQQGAWEGVCVVRHRAREARGEH